MAWPVWGGVCQDAACRRPVPRTDRHGRSRTCTDPATPSSRRGRPCQSVPVRVSPWFSAPPRPPRALPAPPHVPPRDRPGRVPKDGARASRAGGGREPRRGHAPGCGRAWRPRTRDCSPAAGNSADTHARNSRRLAGTMCSDRHTNTSYRNRTDLSCTFTTNCIYVLVLRNPFRIWSFIAQRVSLRNPLADVEADGGVDVGHAATPG